jgi:hypothetical protein
MPGWQLAVGAVIAGTTGNGRLSPDMDQYTWWRRTDRAIPDELVGHPLGHRMATHWVGWPLLGWLALRATPPVAGLWAAWAALTGWVVHVVLDAVFGREGYGRGPGVPIAPWWWHVGVGLKSGGLVERWLFLPAVLILGLWLAAWLAGWAPWPPAQIAAWL